MPLVKLNADSVNFGAFSINTESIKIENDAYICAGAVVLPGVTIGEGAVVGANSVVNRNLKPWTIYNGNPIKKVGERDRPTGDQLKIVESMDWTPNF